MLLDVDTGYMKAVPAVGKTVTGYMIRAVDASLSNSSDVVFDCVLW